MASLSTTTILTTPTTSQASMLAPDPTEWPDSARTAYRGVLADLDSWCRTHDSPRALNSWIAEEAVRQGWDCHS